MELIESQKPESEKFLRSSNQLSCLLAESFVLDILWQMFHLFFKMFKSKLFYCKICLLLKNKTKPNLFVIQPECCSQSPYFFIMQTCRESSPWTISSLQWLFTSLDLTLSRSTSRFFWANYPTMRQTVPTILGGEMAQQQSSKGCSEWGCSWLLAKLPATFPRVHF